jgi:hypothetical protein
MTTAAPAINVSPAPVIAGGGRSATLNLGAGAIQIHASPGMNSQDIGAAVRNEITALIRGLA